MICHYLPPHPTQLFPNYPTMV
uniref:Uncharacterized protein n=1 Tax=Rhizophora mucronata TaxID=61149 RepID=A0A2P2KHM2_RHIMU